MDNNPNENPLFGRIRQTRKPAGPGAGNGRLQISDADAFPLLTTLLTTVPAGAKGATPGRVAFFVQNGVLTCCLSCPAMVAVAFTGCEGLQDALCCVEKRLADGSIEWKEDSGRKRK